MDSDRSSFYINLNDYPLYVKSGFDSADFAGIPDHSDGSWMVKGPEERGGAAGVEALGLPMPRRSFLSPLREKPEEYTLLIPFTVGPEQLENLNGTKPFQPGIFLAALGENWEIFFNGRPVKSEVRLDGEGRIKSGRSWRYLAFPLDGSLFVPGTNILAFRIIGTPHSDATGLWYKSPYYIDEYETIKSEHDESSETAICAVYIFIGLYHLLLFINRPKDRYNLSYCFFSILLGIYFLLRSSVVYRIIPNTDITFRLEYASLFMVIPMLAVFLEQFNFGKTIKVSRFFGGISLFVTVMQGILPNPFGDDLLQVWWGFSLIEMGFILWYDIIHVLWQDIRIRRKAAGNCSILKIIRISLVETPMGNIIIGAAVMFLAGIADTITSLYVHYGTVNISRIGLFIFTITTTIILAQRFGSLFRRIDEVNNLLEKSNLSLEDTVQRRTRELERQTEAAKSASQAKSSFLARMSHEIRTPLNVILGLSEVELQKKLPEGTMGNIEKVRRSGIHLLEIVNDILDISKIESGNFEILPGEYEFSPLISEVIQLNIPRIGIKPIEFKPDLDNTIPVKLYGDQLRMKQILGNLLSNAFKYTEEGEVRLEIGWERRDNTAWLKFTVTDTGRGIRQRDMEKLFSEYTQLDAAANRRIEGTGLGLFITRGLVEMMGGTVAADSEYGKGSTFQISLPQGIVDETPIGEQAEKIRSLRLFEEKKREIITRSYMPYGKILVVDDLETNLDVMIGLLMPYGLGVDTALSGREAVEAVRKGDPRYDLVFMDHMMPGMDGVEASRIIRGEIDTDYARTVPIIVLTANAVAGNREMFLKSGFNDFISKPVDIKQLDLILNHWVRNKQSGETLKKAEIQNSERINETQGAENRWIQERLVEGIDPVEFETRYGGGGISCIPILRSFVHHTPSLLENMNAHLEASLPDYAIEAHGLKGACSAVCAAETAALARELEQAAIEGNSDLVRSRHGDLINNLRPLLDNLGALLARWDALRPAEEKEKRVEPEEELLRRLSHAAGEFNSAVIEEVLDNLEQYWYEKGEELIRHLRERADAFDYDAMRGDLEEFLNNTR
jgi:signal transduction histidine kinase/DNA-binding response OmpR family regulator/HPt (histidine-containing phosphotransfer) domain-containing protein